MIFKAGKLLVSAALFLWMYSSLSRSLGTSVNLFLNIAPVFASAGVAWLGWGVTSAVDQ